MDKEHIQNEERKRFFFKMEKDILRGNIAIS